MTKKIMYGKHPCTFQLHNYAENNNLAILMTTYIDGFPEPFANVTVNLSVECEKNCAFVDTNNLPNIGAWLTQMKLAKPTGRMRTSGYCLYAEYEFDMKALKPYVEVNKYEA